MLSDRDRRTLNDIEDAFQQHDPRFAAAFAILADRLPGAEASRRPNLAIIAALLTALLLILGLTSLAMVTAFLLVVAVLLQVRRAVRRRRDGVA